MQLVAAIAVTSAASAVEQPIAFGRVREVADFRDQRRLADRLADLPGDNGRVLRLLIQLAVARAHIRARQIDFDYVRAVSPRRRGANRVILGKPFDRPVRLHGADHRDAQQLV